VLKLLRKDELAEAARSLAACRTRYGNAALCRAEVTKECDEFPKRAAVFAERLALKAAEERSWPAGRDRLKEALEDADFRELAGPSGVEAVRGQMARLARSWDRAEWEQCRREWTVERAAAYLAADLPEKRMIKAAERLTAWNHRLVHQPATLTPVISKIEWGEANNAKAVRVKVWCQAAGQTEWREVLNQTVPSEQGGKSGQLACTPVELIPGQTHRFWVEVKRESGSFVSYRIEGQAQVQLTPRDDIREKEPLVVPDCKTKVFLRLDGLEPQPQPEDYHQD
jgi:hypothetical protein